MYRYTLVGAILAVLALALLPNAPAAAVTPKQKMATCKFGADAQHLTGQARTSFLKNCMANRNDPRGPAVGSPAAGGSEATPEEEPEPKD